MTPPGVVEHQLEGGREGGFDVRGVGQPVCQGLVCGQIVVYLDHFVERRLEPGVSPDQSLHVLTVRQAVLALLSHERVGFLGDLRSVINGSAS
jgi:hypothetical protein